ncbi:MAG: tetratricopeptide repeat protein [Pirellulales bacterium]|nr:tetratricopeptide repeat protein [Pirellulales bacterium]
MSSREVFHAGPRSGHRRRLSRFYWPLSLMAAALLVSAARAGDHASDQFAVGAAHYSAGRWALATEEFEALLASAPLDPKAELARFYLAEALMQQGKYAAARNHYCEYLRRHPAGKHATQCEFRQGEASFLAGDLSVARGDLTAFLRKHADHSLRVYAAAYLGDCELADRDFPSAERQYRQALEGGADSPVAGAARLGLARTLERAGKPREAAELFSELAQSNSAVVAREARFHLATCAYAAQDYEKAVAAVDALEKSDPTSSLAPRARLLRGWSLYQLEQFDAAADQLKSLASDETVAVEARYWLGLTQKRQKEYAAAIATLRSLAADQPKHELAAAVHFHIGDALLVSGDTAGADAEFQQLLDHWKGSEWADDALLGRARAAATRGDIEVITACRAQYESQGAGDALRDEFRRALARGQMAAGNADAAIDAWQELVEDRATPRDSDRSALAEAYRRAGRHNEAMGVLDHAATDTDELNERALLTRGQTLVSMERYDDALACLEKYLTGPKGEAKRGAVAIARSQAALCQIKLGKIDEARESIGRLTWDQDDDNAWIATAQLAEAALAAGETDFAEELFGRLTVDGAPAEFVARGLFGQARIAARAEKYEAADECLAELSKRCPESPLEGDAALLRAGVLEKLDRIDEALHLYLQVRRTREGTPLAARATYGAARAHRRARQYAEAANLLAELVELSDPPGGRDQLLYEQGLTLVQLEQIDGAAKVFNHIHCDHRDSAHWADATYRLAEFSQRKGDYDAAGQLLEDLLNEPQAKALWDYALYLRGQIAAEQGEWTKSADLMERLLADCPESKLRPEAKFWRAEALFRAGDVEGARRAFDRLAGELADHPTSWQPTVRLRRAQLMVAQKDWPGAQELLEGFDSEYPEFQQQHEVDYLRGRCLANDALFEEAREAYRQATRSAAGKTETAAMAQWMIGETYFHQKNYRAAIKEYLRVEILYAFPTWQAAALLQAGKCHELLGERDAAAELFGRLLKSYPETEFADEAARLLSLARHDEATKRS